MEAEVIGRVHLIPPRGILAELKPVVLRKFNGGEFKYIDGSFRLPSDKMKFEIEAVVDDDCNVCPVAVELLSELAAKFENVIAKVYNITYVKSPFEPITATPTFRINGKVRFTGIPLDPDGINRYFSEFLKEAYIVSHPKLQWLVDRIRRYAEMHGYRRNPNDVAYMNLVYKLLKNIDEYGHPYCPCRPLKKKPGMSPEKIYELNKDKICPCMYAPMDIKSKGHCLCGLFWTKEKVDEYIRKRLEKYGWILNEIEQVQKALEELKK
ncbi:MAG: hypothetical protein DRJ60_00280, partial [Thermoprotei archaeon]